MDNTHKDKQEFFLQAYNENSDALFRHCYFRVSSREIALDLTQDTFMKTWEYVSKGHEVKNLRAFLFKVLGNAIIDHYRKHKTESLDLKIDEGMQFESKGTDTEKESEVGMAVKAIQKLPDQYKDVIFMRYIDDLSPKEIAEILEEEENNISVRIHRGVAKLKEILHI